MTATIQFGEKTITADAICEHLSNSDLLPHVLRELIIDEILKDWEEENNHKLPYDRAEFAQACDRLAQLSEYEGLNHLQIYRIADRHLKLQKFREHRWGNRVYNYYLQRKDTLDRVSFSMMEVRDLGLAEELYFRIQRGEQSFRDLAFKYSQGEAARDGGRLDDHYLYQLHPEISDRIKGMEAGSLSDIFTLNDSYTFIRVEHYTHAKLDPDIRQSLLEELFSDWVQQEISRRLGLFTVRESEESIVDNPVLENSENSPALPSTPAIADTPEISDWVEPSSSFFFPKAGWVKGKSSSTSGDFSSFFAPAQPPAVSSPTPDRQTGKLLAKTLSFMLLFSLFLGLQLGGSYIWKNFNSSIKAERLKGR
jgi:hypothetical protein